MSSHGFGIVGAGVIAATHARAIPALPSARLVAVTDVPGAQDGRNALEIVCAVYESARSRSACAVSRGSRASSAPA